MGIEGIRSTLQRHTCLGLDTSIFIYQVQSHPRYVALTHEIALWLERSGHRAVTSTITMTELLVQPYRLGDDRLVNEFYALLSTYPNLQWLSPSLHIAGAAARIRAEHRLRTPDAIQAATAIVGGATALVTNDPEFRRLTGIEVHVLEDFL